MVSQYSISLRPKKLTEVFGQESVVKELKERVKTNTWPTAMLFKGNSGTGKTSVAQIVAMTINCKNPNEHGDPCGTCPSCLSIIEERFDRDVRVLDGSSFSGKEDVTSFMQIADTAPMWDKNRILIIEESDQLSTAAKNALLKMLEKPREEIYFILLSMVASGLPVAITSRCQSYNFKSFTSKDIMYALKGTMDKLGLWEDKSIPDSFRLQGLSSIASSSRGSLRTAIQSFEKCVVGKFYTPEDIRMNLGIVDDTTISELLSDLLSGNKEFFRKIEGVDLNDFFNITYATLSQAYQYSITGYTTNEYFQDQIEALSQHPKLSLLMKIYTNMYEVSKGYNLKVAYIITKFVDFIKSGSMAQTLQENKDRMAISPRRSPL